MQHLYATQVASISELKKNPTKLINESQGQPVAILNHNTAAAYLVPIETYERLLNLLDDQNLEKLVYKRTSDNERPVKIKFDKL